MKKRTLFLAAILSMGMVSSMIATTRSSHSEVMTKEADGTYIINTTTLCKDVKGFFLEINIKPLFLPIQAFARLITLRHIL